MQSLLEGFQTYKFSFQKQLGQYREREGNYTEFRKTDEEEKENRLPEKGG